MKKITLLFASCMLLSGCGFNITSLGTKTVWVTRKATLTLPAEKLKSIDTTTHNGSVSVVGKPDIDEITIAVDWKGGASTLDQANAAADAIDVFANDEKAKGVIGWKWKEPHPKDWRAQVNFVITMPAKLATKLTSHNGAIKANEISGALTLVTHNGQIEIKSPSQVIKAETHNGTIRCDGAPNEVSIVTHNGSVKANLATQGAIGGSISTHNGSVTVKLDSDINSELNCKTENGRVKVSVPMKNDRTEKRRVSGTIGSGGPRLNVETRNGSITIEPK